MDEKEQTISLSEIKQIIRTVKATHGFDFGHYALSSFQRRILRILRIHKLEDVEELCDKIKKDAQFYDLFLKEITVNTTEMFRDPSMWRALREAVIEKLKAKAAVNIWHAGCSSGEEVYSMTIMLKEAGLYDKTTIYATDINTTVINNAKKGIYPKRNMELNDANYNRFGGKFALKDYYSVTEDKAQMTPALLKNVKFQVHNLVQDGIISKFDLILCRNVLIYFDKVLQDRVFKIFHESMLSDSHLVIGAKESMVWCSVASKFYAITDREKIFKLIS